MEAVEGWRGCGVGVEGWEDCAAVVVEEVEMEEVEEEGLLV